MFNWKLSKKTNNQLKRAAKCTSTADTALASSWRCWGQSWWTVLLFLLLVLSSFVSAGLPFPLSLPPPCPAAHGSFYCRGRPLSLLQTLASCTSSFSCNLMYSWVNLHPLTPPPPPHPSRFNKTCPLQVFHRPSHRPLILIGQQSSPTHCQDILCFLNQNASMLTL